MEVSGALPPIVCVKAAVVGADGARSRVARDLGLDRNRHLLVGAEQTYAVAGAQGPPAFHCVVDPDLAPGYLAWLVNEGGPTRLYVRDLTTGEQDLAERHQLRHGELEAR